MKLKSLLYTGLCSVALFATSCTDSEPKYEPAPDCETPEVYFSPASTTSFSVGENDTEYTVTVYRDETDAAATFPITVAGGTDESMFTVPASVSFAAGEKTADFTVTYVATALDPMKPYEMTYSVGDGVNTPYAYQKATYTVTYFPWEDVVGPNGEEYGTYVEDCLTTFFSFTPNANPSWQIKIQSSPAIKGLYRIVNCYENFPVSGVAYDDSATNYLYFNASDPTQVFLCDQTGSPIDGNDPVLFRTGLDLGYGTVYLTGNYNLEAAKGNIATEYAGTLVNGVLKFPEKALLIAMANYQNGNFYYANTNGKFRILFPGAEEEADPDDVWESIGMGQYTDVLICPFYGGDPETWSVEVEQYKKDPNLYRMVNPYKDGVMPDGWNYDGDKYLVFDATDPQCVLVEYQQIWEDPEAPINGDVEAVNVAYNLMLGDNSIADIIAAGYGDTFADNTFTFGSGHLRMYLPNTSNASWQGKLLMASEAEGKLVLNAANQSTADNRAAAAIKRAEKVMYKQLDMMKRVYDSRIYTGPKLRIK